MQSTNNYDIAIIGAGAAGLHLALAMRSVDFVRESLVWYDKYLGVVK